MDPLILLVVAGLFTLAGKLLELWLEYHSGLFREAHASQVGFLVLALVLVLAAIAISLHRAQAQDRGATRTAAPGVVVELREPQPKPPARPTQQEQPPVEAPPAKVAQVQPAPQPQPAAEKQEPAAAEKTSEKQFRPQQSAPQATPPAAKPPQPRPDPAPVVSPQVAGRKPVPSNLPPQGESSTVYREKAHVVKPRPAIGIRYRPRTIAVHVVDADTEAFEAALSKHGFHYRSTPLYSTPRGPRWYVYRFEYQWHEATVSTPEQLEALEAELKGLAGRFRLPVEVRR